MLRTIELEDSKERWQTLLEMDLKATCFLVSDIKSKLTAENLLIEKWGVISGDPVLRIKDFYKEIFEITHPDWEVVSENFLREIFLEFSSQHPLPWVNSLQSSGDFFNYLNQFLPLLSHPESVLPMKEWLKSQEGQSLSWRRWYDLTEEFFEQLKEKKWIHPEGVKGLLLNELSQSLDLLPHSKKIIVDLGVNFDFCEQEILNLLASKYSVTVLIPYVKKPTWKSSIESYQMIKESCSQKTEQLKKEKNKAAFFQEKYESSSLKEVKKAVAQVRKWVDEGVKEEDIAILSSHIEQYWFSLKPHLDRENILAEKTLVASLGEFSEVLYWLSSLKVHLNEMNFFDLESRSFYSECKMKFSKFQALFFKVPQRELFKKRFCYSNKIKNKEESVSGKEFVEWALSFWPKDGDQNILADILNIFQTVPLESTLKWKKWLRFTERSLFSKEVEIEEEQKGISCVSFNALNSLRATHVIVMGLDEESLKETRWTSFTQDHWDSLIKDLGFPLYFPHPYAKEQELEWFLQSSFLKEVVFSFSSKGFSGEEKTPSAFFLSLDRNLTLSERSKGEESHLTTVWDSRKSQKSVKKILDCSGYDKNIIKNLELNFHSNKTSCEVSSFKERFSQISPNALEEYERCPFKFAAKKVFHIKDEDEVDREFSPLYLGDRKHKFLESLIQKDASLDITEEELEKKVQEMELNQEMLIEEKQKLLMEYYLKNLGKAILEKEREQRAEHPNLQVFANELPIECFWDQEKGSLSAQGGISFKGRVDRVDFDKKMGAYFVIDYKGGSEKTHMASWLNQGLFQLGLYAQALEEGLIKGASPHPVLAMFYYSLKSLKAKGYVEKGQEYENFFGKKVQAKKERKVFEEFKKNLNQRVQEIVQSIEEGAFSPKPKDKKSCLKCNWRTWCRAKHLN